VHQAPPPPQSPLLQRYSLLPSVTNTIILYRLALQVKNTQEVRYMLLTLSGSRVSWAYTSSVSCSAYGKGQKVHGPTFISHKMQSINSKKLRVCKATRCYYLQFNVHEFAGDLPRQVVERRALLLGDLVRRRLHLKPQHSKKKRAEAAEITEQRKNL
jgi:hypothetical protein